MIPRYENEEIKLLWTNEEKLKRWDSVELAVLEARAQRNEIDHGAAATIDHILTDHPADIAWWLARDKEVGHDLNAYIDERRRHLRAELQYLFHQDMTSFDTEEAAFAIGLIESTTIVELHARQLYDTLKSQAHRYRYLPMLDRTHGQWAKLCSFGGRLLTYVCELRFAYDGVEAAVQKCRYSRLSGAIGNYGAGLDPDLEAAALKLLGLEPFRGATQILPRSIYAPLAQALLVLAKVVEKIAVDIRLGARSGTPIVQEPFGKKQKGSSAMPHKKNTILTEQMTGMARLAEGYVHAIERSIETWERRAIEQSSVERVAWPDLFHVVLRMLTTMEKVCSGLTVYPDHMLREIVESRGTYASDEAKNFLAKELSKHGIDAEVAYRILQLASFNAFEPKGVWKQIRETVPESFEEAVAMYRHAKNQPRQPLESIQDIIPQGCLTRSDQLEAGPEIEDWNALLPRIFDEETRTRWDELFSIPYLLKNEERIFVEVL